LAIYGAYWRDDPQFDVTNTLRAAPHLPCPEVDREMMSQLARYAIEANFGKSRRTRHKPEFDVHHHMRRLHRGHDLHDGDVRVARLGIQVDGPGGGQWELSVRDGSLVGVDDGVSRRSTAVFHVHSAIFRSLVHGEFSVSQAVASGRVRIEGNGMDRRRLEDVLQAAATSAVVEVAR
jgi:hypothetical protein